ncbi:ribosome silencing factor [Vibrio sp.]|uniref:Ribosomal silencing factor RsfS n=1 Tax=Vibrio viridaestus TaxID=2487322 RepID=A0A3N9TEK6_9VIBR|nr:ribosome silencing factor [Vibrio viridaestus]MDC0611583.1 ribosome silencing factor [Vibrio sp.]RQW62460.1 ribosome silencing factor [Vibrio viridaestus]
MQQHELKEFLADKADDMKAENIITLDVKDKSSLTDYMIICTGTSKRHVSSIASHVAIEAKKLGMAPIGIEGENEGEWVVLDMGSSMLHVMQEELRDTYQLEKLWS